MRRSDGNLGQTTLRRRTRSVDPMAAFDKLPPALRHWMHQAALPWSPTSCARIWRRAAVRGATPDQILARLDHAEQATLKKASQPSDFVSN